jgi:hypothetical protein
LKIEKTTHNEFAKENLIIFHLADTVLAFALRTTLPLDLPNQYIFCPFAVETLGTFGEEALQLASELEGRLRSTTGDAREKTWLIRKHAIKATRIMAT